MNDYKKKSSTGVWAIILFISICLIGIGATVFIYQYKKRKEASNHLSEIQESVNAATDNDPDQVASQVIDHNAIEQNTLISLGIDIPKKEIDWQDLHEQNADIYAWIYVPDTTVDYPIVQHPTDNNYYLNYNLDGSYGYPGCIYTENYNTKTFSDLHTVIYGHNLKDHTMFSTLHNFEDPDLMAEDHYIYIYTDDYVYVYEIFGAYEYSAIHLLDNYDLSNEYVYEQYIRDVLNVDHTPARVANIRHDIPVTKEDHIVTLSTCTKDDVASLRFLVVGVLLNPREGDESI
ncbi:MAG: class B sortase [Lachnospiraceae bacterium]|nr:class B sortase [Lachnospiraceae bacterium]